MSADAVDVPVWLSDARAGSREALGKLFDLCHGYLLLVARGELDTDLQAKGGASDVVQETFFEAQRDFAAFHGTTEKELLAWLRRLLLNNLSNFSRDYRQTAKRAVDREVPLGDPQAGCYDARTLPADTLTPSGHALADEQRAALERALLRLPADYREIIRLRYEEGRPFADIALAMQRSPNAVRKLWARALEQVRKEMGMPT
jgi:RNA polymerase sigma-70 factor (ECF subfamily)